MWLPISMQFAVNRKVGLESGDCSTASMEDVSAGVLAFSEWPSWNQASPDGKCKNIHGGNTDGSMLAVRVASCGDGTFAPRVWASISMEFGGGGEGAVLLFVSG